MGRPSRFADIRKRMVGDIPKSFPQKLCFSLRKPNARLRGWQRITTKLNHNNRNHRGSLGLETPRVDSPS
ncbi:hypothetical protein EAY42_16595 [Vibrio anguillarum]|nr:hypothetical protein [Vibrio anguillarum]